MRKNNVLLAGTVALATIAGLSAIASATAQPSTIAARPNSDRLAIPSGNYVLDPYHAWFGWSVVHMGLSNYTARFAKFSANIAIDQSKPEASAVNFTVDVASVQTGFPVDVYKTSHATSPFASFDDEIAKAFLKADKFPTASFKSTKVAMTGPGTADVTGDLTIAGVTKPITMKATMVGQTANHMMAHAPAIGVSVTGQFNRADYGIAGPFGPVATIRFEGEFIGKGLAGAPKP